MSKFNPPIENRDVNELIEIANSTTEYWQQDAIDIAQNELRKRGITKELQEKIIEKWQKEFEELEIESQKQFENNKSESYSIWQMLRIITFAPFYLFGRIIDDYTIFNLRNENYIKKFWQRLILLSFGIILWIVFIITVFNYSENKRMKEIESVDISEWEMNRLEKKNASNED